MRFEVRKQPDEPFEKTFDVSEGTESVTVQLSASDRRNADDEPTDGEWTLRVMPEDTVRFRYEILRDESSG